jgi:hypothetical protein
MKIYHSIWVKNCQESKKFIIPAVSTEVAETWKVRRCAVASLVCGAGAACGFADGAGTPVVACPELSTKKVTLRSLS